MFQRVAEKPKQFMASFESAVFGGGGSKSKESEKYPLRRVEPALRRFVKVADIDLNRLRQHRGNIEKLRVSGDVHGLRREHINATRTVQQLQAHIRQMEQTRAQVRESDLQDFDRKVEGIQLKSVEAVKEFLCLHGNGQDDPLIDLVSGPAVLSLNGSATETSPLMGEERIQLHMQRKAAAEADAASLESWQELREGLVDLNGLIHDFSSMVASQQEQVDRIEDNIERTSENVNQGSKHLVLAAKWKSAVFPAVGALIGGAVGGPVGFVAGIKLGGLAAVGGGLIGFTGGSLLKRRQDRVNEMELHDLKSGRQARSLPELPISELPTDESGLKELAHKNTTTS